MLADIRYIDSYLRLGTIGFIGGTDAHGLTARNSGAFARSRRRVKVGQLGSQPGASANRQPTRIFADRAMQPEQLEKITGYFILEAKEHLDLMSESLDDFPNAISDPDRLQDVYRGAHSIKGGAAMLGIESIRRVAHRLEDFFKAIKNHPVPANATLQAQLQRVCGGLQQLVGHLEAERSVPDSVAAPLLDEFEPLFVEIERHIEALQKQAETPAAHKALHQEIASALASLRHLASAADCPEHRHQAQADCRDLAALGQEWDIPGWSDLLNAARAAIATPSNDYASTLNLIVRDIEAAADRTAAGCAAISPELQALVPPSTAQPASASDLDALDDIFSESDVGVDWAASGLDSELSDLFAAAGEELPDDLPDSLEDLLSNSEELWNAVAPPASNGSDDLSELFSSAAASAERELEPTASEPGDSYELSDLFGNGLAAAAELEALDATEGEREPDEAIAEFLAPEPATPSPLESDLNRDLDSLFATVNEVTAEPLWEDAGELAAEFDLAASADADDFSDLLAIAATSNDELEAIAGFDTLSSAVEAEESAAASAEPAVAGLSAEDFAELDAFLSGEADLAPAAGFEADDLAAFADRAEVEPVELELESLVAASGDLDDLAAFLGGDREAALEIAEPAATPAKPVAAETGDFAELEALFGEPAAPQPVAASSEDFSDLDALFVSAETQVEAETVEEEPRVAPAASLSSRETSALDDLFAAPVEPNEELPAKPEPAIAASGAEVLHYYDRFEDLADLIERAPLASASELAIATSLEELEALLEIPATVVAAAPPAEAKPASATPGHDDEFGDLEELLNETRRQAGEIPATPEATTVRTQRSRTPRAKVEQTLKVPVRQMDNLSNLVGELVVNRNSLEGDEERLRQFLDSLMHQVQNLSDVGGRMQDLYERSLLEDALLRSRREYRHQQASGGRGGSVSSAAIGATTDRNNESDYDSLEMDSFTKFHELAQETIEMIVRVRESASDIQFLVDDIDQVARTLRQVTSQLQEGLTKLRMVPFERTANRLPLAVRRVAPQLGKQANLRLEGQDTLIDKMILEHLSDPLTHLVNNALTHGIEPPEIRTALGKPQAGQIVVSALQQGNQTVIAVSDDGAGIDPELIKQKAVQKGILAAADAKRLTPIEVYDLLFHPGFTTRDVADNFAGRGVGLDVVRTSINEIRGAVSIDSKLGRGTTFTIRLPLTLSICKALCCISENAPIAFPLDGVEDMLDVPQHKLTRNAEGHLCVPWRDRLLPYSPLSELLSYNRRLGRGNLYGGKRDDNMLSVVILRSASSQIAVGVDQVLGEQEIVIKQLSGPIPKPAGIAGATVQGDGRIMAIADVLELIEISAGRMRKDMTSAIWQKPLALQEPAPNEVKTEPMVLIVDDSITVRELLSMTFSKAGYRVEQARDGQDAWDKLHSGLPCDIVFCDIEMPRVDGLELLSRLQKNEELCELPVAMLTSRGAERHRRVAAELGASGYFTKPYLEEVLLDAAQRMIAGEVLLEGSTRPSRPRSPSAAPPAPAPEPAALGDGTPTLVQAPPEPARQPCVLIIDDSVTVRSLLSMTFEKAGYAVEQARDGKDAWDKLSGGLEPDLVLCDIEMPRLDGLELLAQIQQDSQLRRIPVAMLTSRGAKKHRQIAAERGASAYFTKPYVEQELLAAAERVRAGEVLLKESVRLPGLTTHPQAGVSAPATSPPTPSEVDPRQTVVQVKPAPERDTLFQGKPKVLIIDDSVTVRSLLSMTFENAGYEVEQARDGQDALKKLQDGLNPHLVFCDIEMPRMDGLKLLSHLQEDPALARIPVAMLTSRGAKKHRQIAAERGAKGYFTKPYVEDVLLDAANRLMNGEVLLEVEA